MKAFLLYRNRDFDPDHKLPSSAEALTQDLELETLFAAMASGDGFLLDVARKAVLSGMENGPDAILYRQGILKDCLDNAAVVRGIYALAVEAIEKERKNYWGLLSTYPGTVLYRSREVLELFLGMLKRLRRFADEHAAKFGSEGFRTFFGMLRRELGDDFFTEAEEHLRRVNFRGGVLVSAELGTGNKARDYTLLWPEREPGWFDWLFEPQPLSYTYHLHPMDESGSRALSELRDRGISLVANALAQSNEHILSFFSMLRTELAFYVGCLNLHESLSRKGEPTSFPHPDSLSERRLSFDGLYDVSLALRLDRKVVGNDVDADGKQLVVVTGANQGGKSTFLRSVGQAQLMMQSGMFVPAVSFRANVCDRLFTHFKREEDASMTSGKLDEELGRMSGIVDTIPPNSMLLFNESFAATNEREGSEIARQVTTALVERRIKVLFVTHLYEFAHGLHAERGRDAVFLRAQRREDGQRTFKLVAGEPLPTSYGEDLYESVFGQARAM